MSMRSRPTGVRVGGPGPRPDVVTHMPAALLAETPALRALGDRIRQDSAIARRVSGRTLHHIAADAGLLREIGAAARDAVISAVRAARPGDYRHVLRGLRDGRLHYVAKRGLTEVRIESPLARSERTAVAADDFATSKNVVEITVDRDKRLDIEVVQKLGVAGDYIATRVERVPASSAAPVRMNLRPGLGGFDLTAGTGAARAPLHIDAVIGGTRIRRLFNLPVDGGVRVDVSPALGENVLGASRIDALFAPSQDATTIPGA
jgi:hypothetical protein